MPEARDWQWPWERSTWDQSSDPDTTKTSDDDDSDDNKTPKATGLSEEKEPVKAPPQYAIESAEIVVPNEGLKKGKQYQFKGKARRLEGASPANAKISAQALYRYKDKEQATGNPTFVEVNKSTLKFEGTIDELFEPDAYFLDKKKPADAKYKLLLKLRGGCLDKDTVSKEVELPMAGKDVFIKKGCYDEVWADAKKNPAKFPKSGENYIPGNAIKTLQGSLIKFNFLSKNTDDGYYGEGTETAVKEFQKCSLGQKRSGNGKEKMFYIMMSDITFQGEADGIYKQETEQEMGVWLKERYVRPVEGSATDDSDISVSYSGSIKHIPENALKVLKKLLKEANISSVIITSTVRTPDDQARIMYNNILTDGIKAQRELYGNGGNLVIDEYTRLKELGNSEKEIKQGMKEKIVALGPTTVSKHCCDPTTHSIFDIAPSSIKSSQKKAFVDAIKTAKERGEIYKYFLPPGDPAYHLEVIL